MLLTELRTDDDWGMGNNVAVQYKVRNALPGMKLARDWRLCLAMSSGRQSKRDQIDLPPTAAPMDR